MAKIHFHTLGCRLNQAEAERLAQGFVVAGHEVVETAEDADILVVNTCSVTASAGAKSRRAAGRARPGQRVVVTGCHSQVRPEDFANAHLLVRNEDKNQLVERTLEQFGMDGDALGMDAPTAGALTRYPLFLNHTRAFVKIQDGCNLRCTFCMTRIARGASHSRSADAVVKDVQSLAEQGCKEVVLTGVHAGSYFDLPNVDLGGLLARILNETAIPRVRLSSLEPWNFKSHWLELWGRFGERLCRHLHMSVQSGSDSVLRRMARTYDARTYADKVAALRSAIPELGLTTDIIVGFPGETETEHAESVAFVEEMRFTGAHIFTYSSRPGTPAADMPGQTPGEVKQGRYREMKAVTDRAAHAFRESMVSRTATVLWEEHEADGQLSGLTDHYLRVLAPASGLAVNELIPVRLVEVSGNNLLGRPRFATAVVGG